MDSSFPSSYRPPPPPLGAPCKTSGNYRQAASKLDRRPAPGARPTPTDGRYTSPARLYTPLQPKAKTKKTKPANLLAAPTCHHLPFPRPPHPKLATFASFFPLFFFLLFIYLSKCASTTSPLPPFANAPRMHRNHATNQAQFRNSTAPKAQQTHTRARASIPSIPRTTSPTFATHYATHAHTDGHKYGHAPPADHSATPHTHTTPHPASAALRPHTHTHTQDNKPTHYRHTNKHHPTATNHTRRTLHTPNVASSRTPHTYDANQSHAARPTPCTKHGTSHVAHPLTTLLPRTHSLALSLSPRNQTHTQTNKHPAVTISLLFALPFFFFFLNKTTTIQLLFFRTM